ESIKMILSGYAWNTSIQDLITIAAFLEFAQDEIFPEELKPQYKEALAEGKFTLFANEQKKVVSYSEYKTDLMVADEFMRYLLIFYEFKEKLFELNIKNIQTIEVKSKKG